MSKTSIEWTDFTVNPFRFRNRETGKVGHHCTKISPGCKNCYSSTMQSGPYLSGLTFLEENKPKGEFFLDEAVLQQVLRRKKPARVFWCDMSDMFLEDYPDEWIDRCFAVMALTPHLTHQVLTKRAKRMREYFTKRKTGALGFEPRVVYWMEKTAERGFEYAFDGIPDFPLPNVWLGVSAEDQPRADERIVELLQTPAAVRFLSVEPMLGSVDLKLDQWVADADERRNLLGWVICGGESGPGARPFDIAWARSIVQQCKDAGVPCFVKQLGAHIVASGRAAFGWPINTAPGLWIDWWVDPPRTHVTDGKGGKPEEWPEDLRVRQMPEVRV